MHRVTQRLAGGSRRLCLPPAVRQPEVLPGLLRPALTQHYATDPNRRPGFFESFIDNLKQEYSKSKEMKDSLQKFREEAKKLEESEALKEARRKFQNIEGESTKSKSVLRNGHLVHFFFRKTN